MTSGFLSVISPTRLKDIEIAFGKEDDKNRKDFMRGKITRLRSTVMNNHIKNQSINKNCWSER